MEGVNMHYTSKLTGGSYSIRKGCISLNEGMDWGIHVYINVNKPKMWRFAVGWGAGIYALVLQDTLEIEWRNKKSNWDWVTRKLL
jgi:hypothetical protein